MRTLISIIVALLVSANALGQSESRVDDFLVWEVNGQQMVETGRMKASIFFAEAFAKASKLPSQPFKIARMQWYSESIPVARRYENRKLTKYQYEDELRRIDTLVQADFDRNMQTLRAQQESQQIQRQALENQRLALEAQQQAQNKTREEENERQRIANLQQDFARQQAQERANQQARKEQANQQFMQGMMLLEAGRPRFGPPPAMSPSVNCTSRAVGNTVQTNCF